MAVHIHNDTALALAFMAGRVLQKHHELTVLVKGAFALAPDGQTSPMDRPLFSGDVPWDDDPAASCRYGSDFAPFKPRADVLVVGTCHAPNKRPAGVVEVAIGVGGWKKRLSVFGDRRYEEKVLRQPKPGEPTPFRSMPLRYERAFGGAGFAKNPVGVGWSADGHAGRLPNIELPAAPIGSPSDRPDPAGFGPVDRRWAQRTGLMGSYDAAWLDTRWPFFPLDFEWGYFNAAPADQQLPYLRGDERWFVEGMHADVPRYESRLPGVRPRCFLRRTVSSGQAIEEVTLQLDTMAIDMDAGEMVLVWRGLVAVASREYEEIDKALLVAEPVDEQALPAEHYRQPSHWQSPDPSEEELAAAEELAARGGAKAPPVPEAEHRPPDPDAEEIAEVAEMRQELVDAEADPALLERLTGVTSHAVFAAITSAYLQAKVDQAGSENGAEEDDEPEEGDSLESMRAELTTAGADPALLERLARATTSAGFLAILMSGLPKGETAEDEQERSELLGTLEAMSEEEKAAALAEEAKPRAERGERLTRDEVLALARAGESLADANLTDLDLSELDLAGADLCRAKLDGARLERTRLSGAKLTRASLRRAQLGGATLTDVAAEGADLGQAKARGADLSRANLARSAFVEADLTGAKLDDADLTAADLTATNLTDAHLAGALLEQAVLHGTVLCGARAEKATLRSAIVVDASFAGANLDGAVLSGCRIERTDFAGASLRDAFLEQLEGSEVSFVGADLTGARAGKSRWLGGRFGNVAGAGSRWSGAQLDDADFSGALLVGADFSKAQLSRASFRRARLEEANLSKATLVGAKLNEVNLFQARLGGADLTDADCRASNLFACELFEAIVTRARFDQSNLGRTCLAVRSSK